MVKCTFYRPPQISEQQLTNILPGSWISAALWSVAPQEENELKYSKMLVQPIALSPKDSLPETRLVNEGMVQVFHNIFCFDACNWL